MSENAFETKTPLRLLVSSLLILLVGATLVFHDYFCNEHLHELCSPLHAFYENPEAFEAESFFGSLTPKFSFLSPVEKIHLYEFIKNIFHPPDLIS